MAKINKKNTQDVFEGLKYVDNLLNEAASVGNPPKPLSFEDKLKSKLKGSLNEAEEVNTKTNDPAYDYEYNYNEAEELEVGDSDKIVGGDNLGEGIVEENEIEGDEDFDFTDDEQLMEAILSEVEPDLETPEDIASEEGATPIEAEPTDEADAIASLEDADLADAEGAVEDPEMVDAGMGDAGAGLGSEAGVSTPSMDAEPGMEVEPSGIEAGVNSPVDQPEEIDMLIHALVEPSEEEESVIGESKEMEKLGYKDAKTKDIKDKVQGLKEGDVKMTKLGDKDITGNVGGAAKQKAVKHAGKGSKVDPSGQSFEDLGDEDITGSEVKEGGDKAVKQPKFSEVVKENEQKTKALYTLAEKVVVLEDEVANLKFSKFKLEKVNAILTLLPELKLATREKLVEKFDSCKSYAETKKLYSEVASMVKEYKRGNINEAVSRVKTSEMKYFGEATEREGNSTSNPNQERINLLMGIKGSDDAYGSF